MAYVKMDEYFNYKQVLSYQALNQLGANDEYLKNNTIIKVAEINVSADTTYVEFTGLNGKNYFLECYIKNTSGYLSYYNLFINEVNTESSYNIQQIYAQGDTLDACTVNRPQFIVANNNSNSVSFVFLFVEGNTFSFYTNSIRNMRLSSLGANETYAGWGEFNVTSITNIRISASITSAISANSKFVLYEYK